MKKAFTLVELIVVIAVIGIIITASVPSYRNYVINKETKEREAHQSTIESALRQCYALEGAYPPSTDVDMNNIPDTFEKGGHMYEKYFVRPNSNYIYIYDSVNGTISVNNR